MTKARDLASASIVPAAVSVTELGYIDGVTSAIQTQMNTKADASAAINPTIVDAKGDIIAATAADAVSRLAVGANDTVLTADSAEATGMKWAAAAAGGMTLISTTTLSGSTTLVSTIPATYKSLIAIIFGVTNGSNFNMRCAPNSNTTAASAAGSFGGGIDIYSDRIALSCTVEFDTTGSNAIFLQINDYAATSRRKTYQNYMLGDMFSSGFRGANMAGGLDITAAITELLFSASAGTFTGGTVLLYGVN